MLQEFNQWNYFLSAQALKGVVLAEGHTVHDWRHGSVYSASLNIVRKQWSVAKHGSQ